MQEDLAISVGGIFKKVLLKNVCLWKRCTPQESKINSAEALGEIKPGLPNTDYPIQAIVPATPNLIQHHVIVGPDGSLWREGTVYLYNRAVIEGSSPITTANTAGDLCDIANVMLSARKNIWDFSGPKSKRPTYYYKSVLKKRIMEGAIGIPTANRKLSNMIGFYRSATERGFKPEQEMWKTVNRSVRYRDRYGFTHSKEVISTDLPFRKAQYSPNHPGGNFIIDGGKLFPIEKKNQESLLEALYESENYEMCLSHLVALTGGPRIQTVFTMRQSCIKMDASPYGNELITFTAGTGTLVDTKGGKIEYISLPEWIHYLLAEYLKSKRYKDRQSLSIIGTTQDQYVFLTESGKPYYVSIKDRALFKSVESGSAIRKFKKDTLQKILLKNNKYFDFRFHDLRASFGMNLFEDHKALGMSELAILDLIKTRLNHGSIEVTQRYLKYRPTREESERAQSEYENHIRLIVEKQRINNGHPTKTNPTS